MRSPQFILDLDDERLVDEFAGGGAASLEGFEIGKLPRGHYKRAPVVVLLKDEAEIEIGVAGEPEHSRSGANVPFPPGLSRNELGIRPGFQEMFAAWQAAAALPSQLGCVSASKLRSNILYGVKHFPAEVDRCDFIDVHGGLPGKCGRGIVQYRVASEGFSNEPR